MRMLNIAAGKMPAKAWVTRGLRQSATMFVNPVLGLFRAGVAGLVAASRKRNLLPRIPEPRARVTRCRIHHWKASMPWLGQVFAKPAEHLSHSMLGTL